jgi:DHA1 family bicyclomycin/chloramphenicol resistance-like MFS transporter
VVIGTVVHIVASVLCAVAPTIEVLGALRLVQGLGASATAVVAMAIVRDLHVGADAAILLSRLMLVLGAAPILAPSLGGAILAVTSWRGIFVVLALAGAGLTAIGVALVPETLPPERRRPGTLRSVASGYRALLRDGTFTALLVSSSLLTAAVFSYVSGASFVLQDEHGLSEQAFGVLFSVGALLLIAGTQLSARLVRDRAPAGLLLASMVASLVVAAAGLVIALVAGGSLVALLVPLWLTLGLIGVTSPLPTALALSRHGEAAGAAAALLGASRFVIGAAAAPVVSVLGNDDVSIITVMTAALAASFAAVLLVRPSLARCEAPSEADETEAAVATATD